MWYIQVLVYVTQVTGPLYIEGPERLVISGGNVMGKDEGGIGTEIDGVT